MNQQITIVDPIFGNIDVKVVINKHYKNTLEVGNKRCCFENIGVFTNKDFHIIMYGDARVIRAELIVDNRTILFKAWHDSDKHEEILFTKQ